MFKALVSSAGLPHPLLTAAGDLQKACDVRESVNLILKEHIHLQAVEFVVTDLYFFLQDIHSSSPEVGTPC